APHAPAPTPAAPNSSTQRQATARNNTAHNNARPAGPGQTGTAPPPGAGATTGTTAPGSAELSSNAIRSAFFVAAVPPGTPTTGRSHATNSSNADSIQTTRATGEACALRVIRARQHATTARSATHHARSPIGSTTQSGQGWGRTPSHPPQG